MTLATQADAIRRIVVTLDSIESGRPVLDVAVRLAAVLGAELEGVFIEDINLIRLSELPFLREIRASSLVEEVISSQSMQRDLRALARQAERMFLRTTQAMGVGSSFRVWRGHTTVETLSSSFEADVLSLRGRGAMAAYHAQSFFRTRPTAAPYTVNSVNVLFNASPVADRALSAACQLAANLGAGINILLADTETPVKDLEVRAGEILTAHKLQAYIIPLAQVSVTALIRAMRSSGSNTVLIAGADHPLFRQAGLGSCLEALTCPVLFVR
jgi:nucleotide-binding universal stress UspA family protein